MRISLLQEHLGKAIQKTNRIVAPRPQLPVLQYSLLKTQNRFVSLTTTNMETTIETSLPAKVEEEGAICIPSKIFGDFVSTLPKETLSLSTKQEALEISGRRTKATIPGINASEFPPFSLVIGNTGTEIEKGAFLKALSLVLFAAATDEARPLLMGVRFEKGENGTIIAATDGYRLSTTTLPREVLSEAPIVIPARSLTEVLRIGEEEKEEKSIRMSEQIEGQLLFKIGDTTIATRRIEGEYPNFRRIIPSSWATRVAFDVIEFTRAVKSAAIFARDSAGIIKLTVTPTTITVSANTPQVGENSVEIDAEGEGEGGTLALNSRFILDLLNNYKGEQLNLEMTGALNPAVFKNPDDPTFLHIIMPVRVQG